MQAFWNTAFYNPIYNSLVALMNTVTLGDVGFAVIILTVIVKVILFPISQKSIRTQLLMKKIAPIIKEMKKNYPKKEDQAKKQFEIYKQYGLNPFSGCILIIIQIPIVIALYYVFFRGLSFSVEPLYSFVKLPDNINTMFLGIVDIHSKSIFLAVIAGITQFIQGYLSAPLQTSKDIEADPKQKTFQEQMSDSMALNMKYIFPIVLVVIAYQTSVAIALYLITSNICTILQEWYIRRKLEKELPVVTVVA